MSMFRIMSMILVSLSLIIAVAKAELTIQLTEGTYEPLQTAVPDFNAIGGEVADQYAQQIADVVRNDLQSSGLFALQDTSSFIQKQVDITNPPGFTVWKITKTDALIVGQVELLENDLLQVDFRLWDIYGQGEAASERYTTKIENWRRTSHKIADNIYKRLTGELGFFDSRIVYIAETGPKTNRVKRLAMMDYDGANLKYLTEGDQIVLTPRFSPSLQQITYMSYEQGLPRVFLFNIDSNRREVLGDFDGMTFAPRFSRDGESVLLTQSKDGNSEIYLMDLRNHRSRRLTNHPAIDTSPSMSPDGDRIVFTSDRGGSPQLYVMNVNGRNMACPSGERKNVCRITYGQGSYSTPVWSPRGDLIAFTKQANRRFFIGVIGIDGEGERILSESYLDEGPDWSPNGRVVIFFREERPGAPARLWSVDLTGRNLRMIDTPTDASDPAWSPLLE